MPRQRRFFADEALRRILQTNENEQTEEEDNENYSDSGYNFPRPDAQGDREDEAEQVTEMENDTENEGNIEIFEDGSDEEEEEESDDEVVYTSSSDVQYSSRPFQHHRRERNILTETSRNLVHPQTEMESFLLFIDEIMLRTLQRHTNRKAADIRRSSPRQYNWMSDFTFDEILACLGILLSAGVDRDNFSSLEDLWHPIESRPFYRVVMSCQRFKFFLRAVRFDNFRDRMARLPNDRLCAISDLWQQFLNNLTRAYVPEEVITVDEQLVGYRGRIPGRTYMPSKPRKYGVKIFWACEAKSGYALNGSIYRGKQGNETRRNLGHDIVMELVENYFGTGREL